MAEIVNQNRLRSLVSQILSSPDFRQGLTAFSEDKNCGSIVTSQQTFHSTLLAPDVEISVISQQPSHSTLSAPDVEISVTPISETSSDIIFLHQSTHPVPEIKEGNTTDNEEREVTLPPVKKPKYENTFKKTVYLVSSDSHAPLKGKNKIIAITEGRVIPSMKFRKDWSEDLVKEEILEAFRDLRDKNFQILMPVSGMLVAPTTNRTLDGKTIYEAFRSRSIYVRMVDENSPENNPSGEEDAVEIIDPDVDEFNLQVGDRASLPDELIDEKLIDEEPPVTTIQTVLEQLHSQIDKDARFNLNIIRGRIVDSVFRGMSRKTFLPTKLVSVVFTDVNETAEGAIDYGGPRREMWRLLLQEIEVKFFEGPSRCKNILLNAKHLKEGLYFYVGISISMSLVQGGPGPRFFAPLLFNSIADLPSIPPTIDDIGDEEVKEQILNISTACDVSQLHIALHNCSDLLGFCGLPPYASQLSCKDELINTFLSFYVIDRKHSAVEQLKKGLETLGVLQSIKKYPELFREVMSYSGGETVSATYMKALFRIVRRGEPGSNRGRDEARAVAYWWDFLEYCEDGEYDLKLSDVLHFVSGADVPPPLGFHEQPRLMFQHDSPTARYPFANTCGIVLHLPISHNTYEEFTTDMIFGISNSSNSFGFA